MLPEELAPALNCAQSTLEKLDLPAGVKVAIGVGPDRGNETPQPEAPAPPPPSRRLEKRDGYAAKCRIRISLRPNAGFQFLNLNGIRLLDRTGQPIQVLESDISFGQEGEGVGAWRECFNGGRGCHSAIKPQDTYPWFSASFDCTRGLTRITVLNAGHDQHRINAYMLVLYGRSGTSVATWSFQDSRQEYNFAVDIDYCTARIAPRPGMMSFINIREFSVDLFDPNQKYRPPIVGHVSSAWASDHPPANCYDGNLNDWICHTAEWDPVPSATLQFWCGDPGDGNGGWSGVLVNIHNRLDCCWERIKHFQVEFLDRGGVPFAQNHYIAHNDDRIPLFEIRRAFPSRRCGIHIFLKPGVPPDYLNLRDVKLTARTGQVAANQLDYWLSSEASPASSCFDGNDASICHTAGSDYNPSLTVRYDCAIDVDYVEIYNRIDCCASPTLP
ncbi:hypothetical protein DFJ74DRAFT_320878 [Hyaloraphidium curvatum]|nr:hypothetical protein DFJ74DRAFT_320878 [Hyaloraphidium curvatum]